MQNDGSAIISSPPSGNNFGTADNVSPLKQFFRNKWVRLILVIDVIAIIAVIAILVNNTTKTAVINFNIAPVDAKIQLNGQGDYSNGSYQVHPGNYEITISHDGLESKTFNLDLQSGYNTTLTAFLKGANDDFNFYTYKVNYDSLQELISIASEGNNLTTDQDSSAEAFIANFQQQYNLYQTALPIDDVKFEGRGKNRSRIYDITIKANNDETCTKTLCLKALMALTDDKSIVERLLKEKGFNTEELQIEYKIY